MLKQQLKKIRFIERANTFVKARLQEQRAGSTLASYRRRAQRQGIRSLEGLELQAALRLRLASRRAIAATAGSKGSLHIFLAYAIANWERILPRALMPFGEVTAFEWHGLGFDDTKPDWPSRREAMNRAMLEAFRRAHARRPVDVIVGYLSGHNTSPETLTQMGAGGAAIFNFCWDDKLHFPGPILGGRYTSPGAIAHAVDLNLTNAPDSTIKYAVHGGLAMFWPGAGHPEIHRPYDVPFEFDVSFVGGRYGFRPELVGQLIDRGIRVECFGGGWPNGSLTDDEAVRVYSRSRINLGFAGVGQSRRLMCIKGRDFEVPMAGGLYLTQDNPELGLVFDVGREIVTYRDASDCADTIRRLLADEPAAAAIRLAGRRRCLRDHTYEARWAQVLRMAGLLCDEETTALSNG